MYDLLAAVEQSMPAQIAEYEEAKRTESVSSATDRVSVLNIIISFAKSGLYLVPYSGIPSLFVYLLI
jgi:hypothetical protein